MLLAPLLVLSQYNIAFHHITTLNGLSDNNVANAAIDHNGYLWICTNEGLNKYDGRVMEKFYKEKFPELKSNNVREVVCDDSNRIWIRSFGGFIAMIDANSKWHSINVKDGNNPVSIYNIIKTKSRGIVLFKGLKQYVQGNGNDTSFHRWQFADEQVFEQRLFYYNYLSADEVIWTASDEFFIMNYALGRITLRKKIPFITSAVAYSKEELYITTSEDGGLYRFNIKTGSLQSLSLLQDQYGDKIFSSLGMISRMADNRLIITSSFAGIYLYDPQTARLVRYKHDPLNRRSVAINNYHNLICDSTGYVLIASPTNGLSYFNVHHKPASWVSAVANDKGFVFDGYINAIAPANNTGEFWMGGYNQLFKWNRRTGKAVFFDYGKDANGRPNRGYDEVLSLCKDANGNLVVGTANNGIVVIRNNGVILKQITTATAGGNLKSNQIINLLADDSLIYVSTNKGLCLLDAHTAAVLKISAASQLHALDDVECGKLWKDDQNRLWIGTAKQGAYCYNASNNSLFNIGRIKGVSSTEVFAFEQDKEGSIYLGTMAGLLVLKNDRIVATYNKLNGLRGDRCENILKDDHGNLWIDNHSAVLKFNPTAKSFEFYDEKAGLSEVGIRARSGYRDKDGVFYFGNESGFSFFHPDSVLQPQAFLKLLVNSIEHDEETIPVTSHQVVELPYFSKDIVIHISAIDLDQAKNIFYRYRLAGYDRQWINEPNINSVRYNGLNPGPYTFELRASADGLHWITASYPVNIVINPAYWQTWWFRFSAALLLASLLFFALKQRERFINAKAHEKARMEEMRSQALQYQLEIEQVINYFASSLSGLLTVDDVLWDVVKTCISQLGFQDCVIYMYNSERTLLIQKAAYGPKNIDYTDIYNRVEISPGSGIVGCVAETGIAEIISDTSNDARYIVDDAVRLSEIAVPLIGSNGVIGVIDSEHPEAGFYNNRHLQILTAIGNMVVNKTEQLEAEANSHTKEVEMARLQRDVATLQLTATRAQMNPHFIFNALNSVQQYILQGHTEEANRYLSRFSRLQREILNHCDKPFIPLKKEIEMLRIYLQLEQLRFNGSFDLDLNIDEELDVEEIKIPPMILQPFVENAIWHGLMPKQGHRKVSVDFYLDDETELLYCSICDNGIGRKASEENKITSELRADYISKGLSLVYRRLQLMQEQMGQSYTSTVTDLADENGDACGTKVEVVMYTGYTGT